MPHAIMWFLVMGSVASWATAQSGSGSARSAVHACSLLTKELVTQIAPHEKPALNLMLMVPPMEDAVGPSGSACSYGGITLQVDPFPVATLERTVQKDWTPVPNVADAAFFHDNRGRYAELMLRSGPRVLTIQMDVPQGKTAVSIQSNTVALAKALLPKLK
jgi:hypothetical protein